MTTRGCCATAGGALPGVLLALLPKCPLCLAAWLAAGGIGVSAEAAGHLREGLMAVCLAPAMYVVGRRLSRTRRRRTE